jgi:hypothetical protein
MYPALGNMATCMYMHVHVSPYLNNSGVQQLHGSPLLLQPCSPYTVFSDLVDTPK